MKLVHVNGDLFDSKDSLFHCVSVDLKMGAGIATEFKERFGNVEVLLSLDPKVGQTLGMELEDGRNVFYLITKEKYWQKPTYEALEESLIALRKACKRCKVTKISGPKIGCGLDKLKWEIVEKLIDETFDHTDIEVTVYTK
jgi:hypothetical protein